MQWRGAATISRAETTQVAAALDPVADNDAAPRRVADRPPLDGAVAVADRFAPMDRSNRLERQGSTTPLTAAHAQQLSALLETLSSEEALWISGYLAAFAREARQPAREAAAAVPHPLTILYGSETGHAVALAKRMAERAGAKGLSARVVDMAELRPQDIKDARYLAIVTSTHGEGDPPDPAAGFYEYVQSRKAPKLAGTKFAVLGLGDSTYEHFCQIGKDFDQRLESLGAERIHARADCDVDYEDQAAAWIEAASAAFAREMKQGEDKETRPAALFDATAARGRARNETESPGRDRRNPLHARILDSMILNGRGSDKETRHIELSLDGSDLAYEPGDSLGIVPENDPGAVEELLAALDLTAEERVPDGASEISLGEALARRYEITALTPRFIELYAKAAGAQKLSALLGSEHRAALTAYLSGRQVIDVARQFPVKGIDGATFVGMLRKLQPRLYSLASSQAAYPDEAHLTVAVVRYQSYGRSRKGVASTYLAERRGIDDTVPVYLERNPNFRLPAQPSTPIIMIGAGTGVAPFRAFLQEHEAAGPRGKSWLFFGDRRFRTDFLYQIEWQRFLKDGVLDRMDVAFSRDQDDKVYVQRRLLEQGKDVYAWLQDGAHLYVCGDAARLAPDVHAALVGIVERQGSMSRERAEEHLKSLQREKRYQRDVY